MTFLVGFQGPPVHKIYLKILPVRNLKRLRTTALGHWNNLKNFWIKVITIIFLTLLVPYLNVKLYFSLVITDDVA